MLDIERVRYIDCDTAFGKLHDVMPSCAGRYRSPCCHRQTRRDTSGTAINGRRWSG